VLNVRRSAGAFTFLPIGFLPLRTSWLIVGNENLVSAREFVIWSVPFDRRGPHDPQ
jgi:hypothetical protein